MTAFKYKFRVLANLKDNQKSKAEKELADLNNSILRLNENKEHILLKLRRYDLKDKKNIKASELNFHNNFKNILVSELKLLTEKIYDLQKSIEFKRTELIERNKEHKVLKKLEEKHYDIFKKENQKAEINNADETAALQFVRCKK